jgi:hypothetical protein
VHGQVETLAHGLDVGAVAQIHLDSGNGEVAHGKNRLMLIDAGL